MLVAFSQISIESNATSDNPITDTETGCIHHGGNFQATSITSAVEKTRPSLQMIGKLVSSQCAQVLDHQMNDGLPPNLAADEPSLSFCCKGLDISIAAHQFELSYVFNSISNHVQSAEMHNQAVNSLAVLSTRSTMQAIEPLSLIIAAALYIACQTIDLRVMHATFVHKSSDTVTKTYNQFLLETGMASDREISMTPALGTFKSAWWAKSASDAPDRSAISTAAFVQALCMPVGTFRAKWPELTAQKMRALQTMLQENVLHSYQDHRADFLEQPDVERYLGRGTKVLYRAIREDLGIPMNRGIRDHPRPEGRFEQKTIGSHVSKTYEAVRSGRLFEAFAEAVVSRDQGRDSEKTHERAPSKRRWDQDLTLRTATRGNGRLSSLQRVDSLMPVGDRICARPLSLSY